jgi:hypothetical protein
MVSLAKLFPVCLCIFGATNSYKIHTQVGILLVVFLYLGSAIPAWDTSVWFWYKHGEAGRRHREQAFWEPSPSDWA